MKNESMRVRVERMAIRNEVIDLVCTETTVTFITTNGKMRNTYHFDENGNFLSIEHEDIA